MIHSITNIRVRYAETDRMDIVYHSNYFVWFEAARIELLDKVGCPYTSLEKSGALIPVLSASADYKMPARFDDRLQIHLFMQKRPTVRFHFNYEVRRDEQLLAKGSTSHAFMDRNGKGLRPPAAFMEKINAYWAENQQPTS